VHDVLARSGLRSGQPAALDFYRTSPGGHMVVACQQDRVTGVAYSVSFGRTGWLGNVAVDPGARGQGIGTAVSAAAIDWLRQAGVVTVLLTATELGRPVYERLGFTDDGVRYGIWVREPAPLPDGGDDPVAGPGAIADVLRLDAEATGEDRGAYLRAFAGRARVSAEPGRTEPGRTGYWLPLPWGGGPIVASSADSARPLVTGMMRAAPDPSLSFPEPNADGADLAVSLGFRLARQVTRMRLGPPVSGYRPERIFNAFSLAAG